MQISKYLLNLSAVVSGIVMLVACEAEQGTKTREVISEAQIDHVTENVQMPMNYSDRFTVRVVGEGPQIILVPGLASSPDVWNAIEAHLKDDFQLHIVHVNGMAGADPGLNTKEGSFAAIAEALTLYANTLEQPAIIGHSMGGLLALQSAINDEDVFSRAMIVDVLPFFSVLIDPMATEESIRRAAETARADMLAQTGEEFIASQTANMARLNKHERNVALTAQWTISSTRETVANIMYDVMTTDLRKAVAEISIPTTVVFAFDESLGFPKPAIEAIYSFNYAALPDVDLQMIEDARHYVMLDQPEAFAEQVEGFVAPLKED